MVAVVIVALLVVGAFFLYPKPAPSSNLVECAMTRFGIFTVVTLEGAVTQTVNATETSTTTYTTTTSVRGSIGKIVTSVVTYTSISAYLPDMIAAGNASLCTYYTASLSTNSS